MICLPNHFRGGDPQPALLPPPHTEAIQQQPLLDEDPTPWPWPTWTLALVLLAVVVPMRSLIWRAMVKKACSTLLAFLAEVSRKGMPRLSANSWPCIQHPHGSRAAMSAMWRDKRANSYKAGASSHLGNRILNHLLIRHVALVADKQLVDALGGVSVNLLEPLLHVVEGVHVGYIVDDADAVGATVVRRRDGSKALLAGRIPLQAGEGALETGRGWTMSG